MALNVLDGNTRAVVAASYALPDLETAVQQVVYNCIDAHAKHIQLWVNVPSASFTTVDDGDGIQPGDLYEYIGRCYASSKLPISKSTEGERKQHKAYGSRGAFLYELTSLAETVEIESRVQEHWTSYRKVFKEGEVVFNARSRELREAPGTKVYVSNLFRKLPVRRKDLSQNNKYQKRVIQNIQGFCVSMSMIWPSLSFDVRFEAGENVRSMTIPATRSCSERFLAQFGQVLGQDLQYVAYSSKTSSFSIRGYFAFIPSGWEGLAKGIKQAKSYYQFAYLENEWVEECHQVCSRVITDAALKWFSAIPIFVLKVAVPSDQYDMSHMGMEHRVVFTTPEQFNQFLIEFVQHLAATDALQAKLQESVQQTSRCSQGLLHPVPENHPGCDLGERPASNGFHDAHVIHPTHPCSSSVTYESAGRSMLQNRGEGFNESLLGDNSDDELVPQIDLLRREDKKHSTWSNEFEDCENLAEQHRPGGLLSDTVGMCLACGHFSNVRSVVEEAEFEAKGADFQREPSDFSVDVRVMSEESDVVGFVPQRVVLDGPDKTKSDLEDIFFSSDTRPSSVMHARYSTTTQPKTVTRTPWLSSKPDASDWLDLFEDDNSTNHIAITNQPRGFDQEIEKGLEVHTTSRSGDADTSTSTTEFGGMKSSYFAVSAVDPSRTRFAREWLDTKAIPVKHLAAALQVDNVHVLKGDRPIKISKATLANLQVIRQVDRKFILVRADTPRGMLLLCIDQHAADERVRLEKLELDMFGRDGSLRRVEVQDHEPPLSLQMNFKERKMLHHHEELVRSWGFDFELVNSEQISLYARDTTGNRDEGRVLLHATPKVEKRGTNVDDFRDFIQLLSNAGKTYLHSQIRPPAITRLLHSRACRSAIMFGDWLSVGQCKDLIEELKTCQLPFQCAHGRPSVVPLAEIQR